MDDKDRQLLGFLRKGISFSPKPFQEIASKLEADSSEIFLRLIALRDIQAAGSLTAVLDSQSLAYQTLLCAVKLPAQEKDFEQAAARINSHPGVVKSHRREHDFNFWFTLMLPYFASLQDHLEALRKTAGGPLAAFPAVKRFRAGMEVETNTAPGFVDFSDREIEVLRKIQEDFPLVDRPFQKWGRDLGTTENDFLEVLKNFSKRGILKRFFLFFTEEERTPHPQNMTVWQVPEEKQDSAAAALSRFPGITQCVQRKASREFPYSLYAYHAEGGNPEETAVERLIGKWPRVNVPVAAEYKNSRPFYFPQNLDHWIQPAEQILKEV